MVQELWQTRITHRRNAEESLTPNVTRSSPVLLPNSLCDLGDLDGEWRRKFAEAGLVRGSVFVGYGWRQSLECAQFLLDCLSLFGLHPRCWPIHVSMGPRRSSDDLEHPLCWVFSLGTRESTVFLKVGSQDRRLGANWAEINGPTTLSQEEKTIESFE